MKTAREIIAGALNGETIGDGRKDTFERTVDAILAALAAEGFSIVETGRDPVTIDEQAREMWWPHHESRTRSIALAELDAGSEGEVTLTFADFLALSRSTREGKTE